MSKFYGTLECDKGESTRCGNSYMKAAAQSYNGSVAVSLSYREDCELEASIFVADNSTSSPQTPVFIGTFKDLAGTNLSRVGGMSLFEEELEKAFPGIIDGTTPVDGAELVAWMSERFGKD